MRRILILGGTTEARMFAARLATRPDCNVLLSLAGITADPVSQPVPTRRGGFGGADGLARFLREGRFSLLIDATHPFAARISANAETAAGMTGIPAFTLQRPPWSPRPGDDWRMARTPIEAVAGLDKGAARRVFVALGRNDIEALAAAPQHHYVVRSIEPLPEDVVSRLPKLTTIRARGPYDRAAERALFERHAVEAVLCKNSGGDAVRAKLDVAREMGLAVHMIDRPAPNGLERAETVEAAEAATLRLLDLPC